MKYKSTFRGIKKESIPSKEMRKCVKCGKENCIELSYPNGYLTLFTCKNCGNKRIEDGTIVFFF